jgi:hypothetical protein
MNQEVPVDLASARSYRKNLRTKIWEGVLLNEWRTQVFEGLANQVNRRIQMGVFLALVATTLAGAQITAVLGNADFSVWVIVAVGCLSLVAALYSAYSVAFGLRAQYARLYAAQRMLMANATDWKRLWLKVQVKTGDPAVLRVIAEEYLACETREDGADAAAQPYVRNTALEEIAWQRVLRFHSPAASPPEPVASGPENQEATGDGPQE